MTLPKHLKFPVYNFTTNTGRKVEFKAMTMGDDKILAMASESAANEQDPTQADAELLRAVKQVLQNNLVNGSIEDLTVSEIEEFFLHIRAVSVSNTIDLIYENSKDCIDAGHDAQIVVSANVRDYKLTSANGKTPEDFNFKQKGNGDWIYMFDDKSGIVMHEPKNLNITESEKRLALFKCIFDGEEVFTDFTNEELLEFLDSLPRTVAYDLERFADCLPTVTLELDVVCPKCGKTRKSVLKGLNSFFG